MSNSCGGGSVSGVGGVFAVGMMVEDREGRGGCSGEVEPLGMHTAFGVIVVDVGIVRMAG